MGENIGNMENMGNMGNTGNMGEVGTLVIACSCLHTIVS